MDRDDSTVALSDAPLPSILNLMESTLAEIVSRLSRVFRPESVYLFGSRARGTATADSDYDVLLVVPSSDEPPYRRAQRAQEALWGLWSAADVFVLTRDEFVEQASWHTSIARAALAEGVRLDAA